MNNPKTPLLRRLDDFNLSTILSKNHVKIILLKLCFLILIVLYLSRKVQ